MYNRPTFAQIEAYENALIELVEAIVNDTGIPDHVKDALHLLQSYVTIDYYDIPPESVVDRTATLKKMTDRTLNGVA